MKYVALIYTEENRPGEEFENEMAEYFAFNSEARAAGAYVVGEALHASNTATTVRVREGKTLTTDGPFAETREILGGFYVLECKDLDEAIFYASKIPGARHGSVEVRPLVDFSQAR